MVVDRSGVTEASAELLRTTGFLNALLHRAAESEDISPLLWVIAVKLDDVAKSERSSFRQQNPDVRVPPWLEFFRDACDKVQQLIRNQVDQELERMSAGAPEATRAERTVAQRRALASMQVHPVSAIEYRKLNASDDDDRPLIAAAEESNIPELSDALAAVATVHAEQLAARIQGVLGDLAGVAERTVRSVVDDLDQSNRDRVSRAAGSSRLGVFLEPKARELAIRQGQLRENLRNTVPTMIESQVARSVQIAAASIREYLATLQKMHWATLRATVRRGGVQVGRRTIDLPNELALRLEEPIAVIWNKVVVKAVQGAMDGFAKDLRATLEQVAAWAAIPGSGFDPKRVEWYRDDVVAQVSRISESVAVATESLRERVKQKLQTTVQDMIRTRCQTFVEAGMDIGKGVKDRVLGFLGEVGTFVVADGARAAEAFLLESYSAVVATIGEEFATLSDPLGYARTLLVGEAKSEQKGEEERRRQIALGSKLLDSMPMSLAPEDVP